LSTKIKKPIAKAAWVRFTDIILLQ
jgi:hypothetical protein